MRLKLVPIPQTQQHLEGTAHQWIGLLFKISERSGETLEQLVGRVTSGEVQLHLAWDADTDTAMALAGTRILVRGDGKVAEIIWLTGSGREHWFPLIGEFETYMRDQQNCSGMRAIGRPGWEKSMLESGYRKTHIVFEKELSQCRD